LIPNNVDGHTILGFTGEWVRLGIVSEEQIFEIWNLFQTSDDKNPEHYRYGAFRSYLANHRPLDPTTSLALYELGERDPDYSMGGAIMADIVNRSECPQEVLDRAMESGRSHLPKLVKKKLTNPT